MTTQPTTQNVTDVVCRLDFASFIRRCFRTLHPNSEFLPNWHIYALAYRLEQVRLGKNKRLKISLPPRYLKSFICSVAFPAFVLGHDPTKRMLVLSYSQDLAIKLTNDFRVIINAPWYRMLFPETRVSRIKNTEFEVVTTRNGFRLGTSIDGSVTGRGGDFIIIDDPLKPMDAAMDSRRERVNDLYNSTLHTRLDSKKSGAIIVVMQRLHPDDLCGMLQRSSKWTSVCFPAIAKQEERVQIGKYDFHVRLVGDVLQPERESLQELEDTHKQMGSFAFAAQYQQAPMSHHGVIIDPKSIRRYDQLPTRTSSSIVLQSWDTASKEGELHDYSACATVLFHQRKIYVADMLRDRFDYLTLVTRAIAHARTYRPNIILVEESGVGIALLAEIKKAGLPAQGVKPQHDKKIRMLLHVPKFHDGTTLLPRQAAWLADFEDEFFGFPHARHDDQVDALSQALTYEPGTTLDFDTLAAGMERLNSGLAFQQLFRGRIV